MFALLPYTEEVLRIDCRVPAGIRRIESLPLRPAPPLLSPSQPGEELFLYLAVSPATVSATLIREEEKVQKPVYYTSRVLHGAEERYLPMEKLAFVLVTVARKLKPYFQAHTIVVLTDRPLWRAMSNPDAAGRLAL